MEESSYELHSQSFLELMDFIIQVEGVYVNDEDDPGGETIVGIARNFHSDWDGWKIVDAKKPEIFKWNISDIKNSTLYPFIIDFYYKNYWEKLDMAKIPKKIRKLYFDTAINMGKTRAKKLLQEAVGAYPDGIIGPKTLNLIQMTKPKLIFSNFKLKRIEFYTELCKRNKKYRKYLLGWIDRVLKIV